MALELSRDYHDPKQKRKTKKVIEVDLAGSIAFAHGWRAPVTGGIGKRTVDSDLAPSRACLLNGWANLRRMNDKAAPVLIGYDGSGPARRAVHEAAELFGSRPALVVTVWESTMVDYEPVTGTADVAMAPVIDYESTHEFNDAARARADRMAKDGAQLARSAGLQAEALALADEANAAKAIVELGS